MVYLKCVSGGQHSVRACVCLRANVCVCVCMSVCVRLCVSVVVYTCECVKVFAGVLLADSFLCDVRHGSRQTQTLFI